MTWTDHISKVAVKLSQFNGILLRVKEKFPRKVLIQIYNTLFIPYLSYCNLVWGYSPKSHTNRLQVLQKRAVRTIFGVKRMHHTPPLFRKNNMLRFDELLKYRTALFIFKLKNKLVPRHYPILIRNLFRSAHSNINTRTTLHVYPEVPKSCLQERTIRFKGTEIWNQLPKKAIDTNLLGPFKSEIKKYLISSITCSCDSCCLD